MGISRAPDLKKPDLRIHYDKLLVEVRAMPQGNLLVDLLQKLVKG